MNNCNVSFKARATGPSLHLLVKLNSNIVFDAELIEQQEYNIIHEFEDIDGVKNLLSIEMTGKTVDHTKVSADGNIIADRVIEISDMAIDNIELGIMFQEFSTYEHDYNGTADAILDQFFGIIGCNGTIRLEFESPVYQWLLENM